MSFVSKIENSGHMYENRKPDIVLKTVNGFNIKRTPVLILISERSLKLILLSSSHAYENVCYSSCYTFILIIGRDPN